MIVVLLNQLFHLADGVFPTVGHMLADVRDFRPDDHAVFVAQIIEILIVLIVRQTDGVAAQLTDERHVLVVHLAGDGVADALAILMAGYAVQGIGLVVEEETLLRVGAERADAERNLQFVGHDAVILQLDAAGVEIRIFHAVPAVRLFDADDGIKPRARADGLSLGVDERDAHFAAGDAALHADIGRIAVRRGRHADTAGAEIVQREMNLVDDQQTNRTINAAVEGEIRLLGIDAVVFAVVGDDDEVICFGKQRRNVHAERGIAAVMDADFPAVYGDRCGCVDAVEFEPDLFAVPVKRRAGKGTLVSAASALVIVSAILSVDVVPGMGNVDLDGLSVKTGELPALTEINRLAHGAPPHVL